MNPDPFKRQTAIVEVTVDIIPGASDAPVKYQRVDICLNCLNAHNLLNLKEHNQKS
jgi:hypothetical protein